MGRIRLCGDSALSVEVGQGISAAVHRRVLALRDRVEGESGVVALVPGYRSLFIQYDPWEVSAEALIAAVQTALARTSGRPAAAEGRLMEIPVCYDPSLGPDLEEVARVHGLSGAEVVRRHAAPVYTVYLLGFTPGFVFLGGLDPRLRTPRLPEPRSRVPAGSVGIAGSQTGAYAVPSPGGWRLVGRTPLRLFDAGRAEPALLRPGDRVRFRPISLAEYGSSGGES
ncbi:MAG: 5-oxoprolinase subunit PxpB [Deltaproteobacteria bacterium]|nr:5-oxoprolinase subunit PxpB [Deltaproteobacteria bacterium]